MIAYACAHINESSSRSYACDCYLPPLLALFPLLVLFHGSKNYTCQKLIPNLNHPKPSSRSTRIGFTGHLLVNVLDDSHTVVVASHQE